MNLWSFEEYGGEMVGEKGCCSLEAFADARAVARQIGIPHYVINFRDQFREHVVNNFKDEYMKGRTPNPCVICNTKIKWKDLYKKGVELGCELISTGHYAKIEFDKESGFYNLLRGDDPRKDQSYFLYGVTQDSLRKTLFPLQGMEKSKVREIAESLGLKTAEKKESQEICFIPDNDYKRFLQENIEDFEKVIKPGRIVDDSGKDLKRKHEGYPFYTVGQRKGLGGGFKEPMFVKSIDSETNVVTISPKGGLFKREVIIKELNWIGEKPVEGKKYSAKIRFNTVDRSCEIKYLEEDRVMIIFDEDVYAVAPGQSGVIYDGNICVGGGVIE
jgi:tRNA-specific 2-thiouridylase